MDRIKRLVLKQVCAQVTRSNVRQDNHNQFVPIFGAPTKLKGCPGGGAGCQYQLSAKLAP
ncbi:MAG: hypothetical protein HOE30_02135 [Deltaproteobacteria bacterium]|nr:hypothetical protein [Deltaproteobacteria bacterium]MBT4269515.1 hypothetical protein [Deltaproteobacteria bacterium]MBT4642642.1 hypothetical protein [Deltaproteobacteria bacterium]MBT6501305.1 hypothetical protein [Deltaproteobacteria bacterium]MBT7151605.1 hypothetical protein [Deltaproteobacteria bacterium]